MRTEMVWWREVGIDMLAIKTEAVAAALMACAANGEEDSGSNVGRPCMV